MFDSQQVSLNTTFFNLKVFFKYFKQIHTISLVINKKVFFENLQFPKIIFDF